MKKMCVLSVALLISGLVSMVHAEETRTHTLTLVNNSKANLLYKITELNRIIKEGTLGAGETSAPFTYQIKKEDLLNGRGPEYQHVSVAFWNADKPEQIRYANVFAAGSPKDYPATATTLTVTNDTKYGSHIIKKE
jgi:hypothetical protein